MAEKVYYCSTCQKGNQYNAITNQINAMTASTTTGNPIYSTFYAQAYNVLKAVRDFGDKDTAATRLPNLNYFTLSLSNLQGQLASHTTYDDIVNCINNNSNSNIQGQSLYGSYWTNLKTTLQNINLPSTRYYEKSCCCEGHCGSDSFYCGCHGGYGGCPHYDCSL